MKDEEIVMKIIKASILNKVLEAITANDSLLRALKQLRYEVSE